MADVAGLVVGAVALVSLFTTCVDCFEMIEIGANYSRDLEVIATSFEAQRVRLIVWGQTLGLQSSADAILEQPEVRSVLWRCLCCIKMLFEDGDSLSAKYGLRLATTSGDSRRLLIFRETYRRFRERLNQSQAQASFLTTAKWTIRDRSKFKDLVLEIKNLIDDMESITQSASLLQRQRQIMEFEIASIYDEDSLNLVVEATLSSATQISSVASQRRLDLQETTTITSSENQTFFSAETGPQVRLDRAESDLVYVAENVEDGLYRSQPERIGQELAMRYQLAPQRTPSQTQAISQRILHPVKMEQEAINEFAEVAPRLFGHLWKRVVKEVTELASLPTERGWQMGVSAFDTDTATLICYFSGPLDGPYKDGIFYLRVHFTPEHPFKPPICQLLTKIYHPNIDSQGRICADILYDQYSPKLFLCSLVVSIASMLDDPNVADPLVPEIAEQYLRDRNRYDEIAERYTSRYATQDLPVISENTPDGRPWWHSAKIPSGF